MEKIFTSLPPEKAKILAEFSAISKAMSDNETDFSKVKPGEWKGYRFIPNFEPAVAKRAYEVMKIEENTVILTSFPKTGTHWNMEILRQILYGHDEKLDEISKSIPLPLGLLEVGKPEKLDLLEHIALPRKIYATHLPEELLNFVKIKKSKGKVIVLVRNPKDQAVSWYHFTKGKVFDGIRDELSPDWNQFFSDYVQGKQPIITKPGEWYPDFLRGWYKHKDDDSIMFLHFEDMKKNPEETIRKLAKFVGVELTDERVAKIKESTTFRSMKKKQEEAATEHTKAQRSVNIMRKGQVGSWKETLTVAQSELMDKLMEEKLSGTDITFTYE